MAETCLTKREALGGAKQLTISEHDKAAQCDQVGSIVIYQQT